MRLGIGLPDGIVDIIREFFFPAAPGCPLCNRDGPPGHLCRACLASWSDLTRELEICKLCGRFGQGLGAEESCGECRREAPPFVLARGVAPYEGVARDALYSYKFAGGRGLARPLGELMAAMVLDLIPYRRLAGVVSVPLHPNRERERRFDQAALLAAEIGRLLQLPLITGALTRLRDTPSQTALSRAGRRLNVAGAFGPGAAAAGLAGKGVLLVDDVFTTGATAGECSQTLLQAGVNCVYVATLATSIVRDRHDEEDQHDAKDQHDTEDQHDAKDQHDTEDQHGTEHPSESLRK